MTRKNLIDQYERAVPGSGAVNRRYDHTNSDPRVLDPSGGDMLVRAYDCGTRRNWYPYAITEQQREEMKRVKPAKRPQRVRADTDHDKQIAEAIRKDYARTKARMPGVGANLYIV